MCSNLIVKGVIITNPIIVKNIMPLTSPRINSICLFRQISMDNIGVRECPQFSKK
jgi:hypothetical protein